MKKKILLLFIVLSMLLGMFFFKGFVNLRESERVSNISKDEYEKTLREDIFSLMMAYPDYIIDIEVENNKIYLILKSGQKILYDDEQEKDQLEVLNNPDLQDMMAQKYVLGSVDTLMPPDYNPGRIRVYPLLKEVYGINQSEIEKNLTGIRIHSNYHRFNDNNNAAHYLKTAISELNTLAEQTPELWSYIYPMGGTYNFRYIAKTNRLSPHAFGISIDLASNKNDYWQWTTRVAGEKRLKSYPQTIVDIMERNYFIWGGKWGHFDILHFEYRPEIIMKARYFSNEDNVVWFENLPAEITRVSNIICLIEEKLQHFSYPDIK